ncbi:sigma factor-like helix-turn-helix DNA-binding protein [Frigoriglobus tundricola]|uniref:sigma factor-like helix-turn-helix DNA-binding protein n=1 Tax=Frigoriglobus tundricola TaxID=2774151 RepID=UPI001D06C78C|nr:sigma factor-like helix-turn-helix DNA-binding protein [Frigoriglobus tundricola]
MGPLRGTKRRAEVAAGAERLNRLRERVASGDAPADERPVDESHTWVLAAEELERLPRRAREALIMYHMEGLTLAQIAETTGCSVTEAHRRVNRGLERLRARLSARGVALTTGLLVSTPAGLVLSTATAAAAFASGARCRRPAWRPSRTRSWPRGSRAAWLPSGPPSCSPPEPPLPSSPTPLRRRCPARPRPRARTRYRRPRPPPPGRAPGTRRSSAVLRGRVTDAAGRPVPRASVEALVRRPWLPGDRGLRDDTVARATTDAGGGTHSRSRPTSRPTTPSDR